MLWLNYLINQPNNFLANTLGFGSHWISSLTKTSITRKYSALLYIFMNYYMKLIFKSGLMWNTHPFINKIFICYQDPEAVHSIPNYVTNLTITKFYRIRRLKLGSDIRLKSQFIYRSYKNYLNLSKLFIYVYNSWIVLGLQAYLPIIYKRRAKFNNLSLREKGFLEESTRSYNCNSIKSADFFKKSFKLVLLLQFQLQTIF